MKRSIFLTIIFSLSLITSNFVKAKPLSPDFFAISIAAFARHYYLMQQREKKINAHIVGRTPNNMTKVRPEGPIFEAPSQLTPSLAIGAMSLFVAIMQFFLEDVR